MLSKIVLYNPEDNVIVCTLCLKKISQVWLAIALTHIDQFLQFLAHVITRDSKIDCRYKFLKYLAFTSFIMFWSEMMEMTHFPRHCYSLTGALCKHANDKVLIKSLYRHWMGTNFWLKLYRQH